MEWLWFLPTNALLAFGGHRLARDGFGQREGLSLAIAWGLLSWCAAVLGVIALGSAGILRPPALLAWAAGVAIAGASCRRLRSREPASVAEGQAPASPWEPESVVVLGCTLLAALLMGIESLSGPVRVISDGPIYHLYFAVRWWKEQRLSVIPVPFGETAAAYFPAGGDCWYAWLIATWGGDLWAKLGQMPGLLLAALVVYAAARRLGAGSSASLLGACAFASVSHLLFFSSQANVDTYFAAFYLVGLYFLMRFALGDDGAGSLALSGLAIGAALSTKPTAILFAPLVVAAGLVPILARPRRARNLAIFLLTPLVMAGYWWGRNAWLTGNPIYPAHIQLGDFVVFQGWYTREAMNASSYYVWPGDWRAAVDIALAVVDPRMLPLWLAAALGLWAPGPRPPASRAWTWTWAALGVLNLVVFWLLVPYRTQTRLVHQALGLLAVPLAIVLAQGRWVRLVGATLLLAHLWTNQTWPFLAVLGEIPWEFHASVPNDIAPPITIPIPALSLATTKGEADILWVAQGLLALMAALALATAWAWSRARDSGWGRREVALACVLGAALVSVVEVRIYPWGKDPALARYPRFESFAEGWIAWERTSRDRHHRVAYAGTNLPFYLMGRGYRHDVRYVNIDEHRNWLMHDYHREAARQDPARALWPYPRPGWDRLRPDYDAWLANLRAAGIDRLVLGKPGPGEGLFNIKDSQGRELAGGFTIEAAWAAAHPETFRLLHGKGDPWIRIYEVLPPE